MEKDVELALKHWQEFNATKHRYARLEIIQHSEYLRTTRLTIGRINEHGIKEIFHMVRHYNESGTYHDEFYP